MVRPDNASYAEIRINALLKFIKDINNCVSDDIDLTTFPWNWKQYLSSFPPSCTCSNVQPDVPSVIQNGPTSPAAPLRQGVRHHGSDRPLPVTGRRHVRCLALQPGTACQERSADGSPKASARLACRGIFKDWTKSG